MTRPRPGRLLDGEPAGIGRPFVAMTAAEPVDAPAPDSVEDGPEKAVEEAAHKQKEAAAQALPF